MCECGIFEGCEVTEYLLVLVDEANNQATNKVKVLKRSSRVVCTQNETKPTGGIDRR